MSHGSLNGETNEPYARALAAQGVVRKVLEFCLEGKFGVAEGRIPIRRESPRLSTDIRPQQNRELLQCIPLI